MLTAFESGSLGMRRPVARPLVQRNYAVQQFRNDASETIPAHAVMRVTGMVEVDGEYIYTVAKLNSSFAPDYLVNGPDELTYTSGSTCYGWGTWLWHSDYALYNTASTPAYNEIWGPESGTWRLKKNCPGFRIKGGTRGTGSEARVIAVQQQTPLWGKPDSSYSADGTGTATLWDRAFSGSLGLTVSSVIFRTRDVTTSTRVSITSDGVAFPIDCEDA